LATADYELILMLDPQAGEERRAAIAAETKSRLESQGTIGHESTWGMRKMAYQIDRRGEADYRYYRFSGEKPLLDDLDHNLKITDGVLRFRIFKVDPAAPVIVPPDTEQIMRRDEDEDRPRGRGRRDDRGPRRPREDGSSGPGSERVAADAG
jgi:small subunit ribosomal protein S6